MTAIFVIVKLSAFYKISQSKLLCNRSETYVLLSLKKRHKSQITVFKIRFSLLFPAFLPINLHTFSEKASVCNQTKNVKRSAMNPFYAQNRAERSLKKRSGRSNVAFLVPFFLCFSLLFGSLQGCVNSIHDPDLDAPALPRWPRFALPHPARQVVCLPVLPPLLRHAYSSAKCMILAKSLCKIPWQMWCDVPNGPADSYAIIFSSKLPQARGFKRNQ